MCLVVVKRMNVKLWEGTDEVGSGGDVVGRKVVVVVKRCEWWSRWEIKQRMTYF